MMLEKVLYFPNGKFFPIEVKAKSMVSKHDARGIQAFKETYPNLKIAKGIIIYAGTECFQISDNVVAVPWNTQ